MPTQMTMKASILSFLLGYKDISGDGHMTARILGTVQAIEKRGRYARMT